MDESYDDYVASLGYDPSLLGSTPVASTGKNDSSSIWGSLGSGLLSSTGSVLTSYLNNQTAKSNAKTAAASSSNLMTIIIYAVVGIAVLGVLFAFLKRK